MNRSLIQMFIANKIVELKIILTEGDIVFKLEPIGFKSILLLT